MTEAEKNEIVGLIMNQISSQAVDFDIETEQPQANDLMTAVRQTSSGAYVGVTIKWDDVARIATELANQAATRAEQAKTNVENMKSSVEQTVTDFNALADQKKSEVESVYQTDLNELKGDLDTERNARIEVDTALSKMIQKVEVASSVNRYEIENLKAKAEGQIYREEIVDANTYKLDIPSSVAPYAELQKLGGKSVVWNQIIQIRDSNYSYEGITYTKQADGTFLANGTSTKNDGEYINKGGANGFKVVKNHKYFIWGSDYGGTTTNYMSFQIKRTNGTYHTQKQTSNLGIIYTSVDLDDNGDGSVFYFVSNGTTLTNVKVSVNVADLTQMFGSGNEPTEDECKKIFSADYYPYDAGSLKSFPVKSVKSLKADGTELGSIDISSFTTDLKSAGYVHDEWSNGKVTKRIGVVDLGTLKWYYFNKLQVFYANLSDRKLGTDGYTLLCNKYLTYKNLNMLQDKGICITWLGYQTDIAIKDISYDGDETTFKSAMNGVMLYYELAEPTEEEVPEIDNYINVEGGGTLTFESDETIHMPVPSTDRFVVDLTSTTEETT